MVRPWVILKLLGSFVDSSMDREKYYKTEEDLKQMTKSMYAALSPGFLV